MYFSPKICKFSSFFVWNILFDLIFLSSWDFVSKKNERHDITATQERAPHRLPATQVGGLLRNLFLFFYSINNKKIINNEIVVRATWHVQIDWL